MNLHQSTSTIARMTKPDRSILLAKLTFIYLLITCAARVIIILTIGFNEILDLQKEKVLLFFRKCQQNQRNYFDNELRQFYDYGLDKEYLFNSSSSTSTRSMDYRCKRKKTLLEDSLKDPFEYFLIELIIQFMLILNSLLLAFYHFYEQDSQSLQSTRSKSCLKLITLITNTLTVWFTCIVLACQIIVNYTKEFELIGLGAGFLAENNIGFFGMISLAGFITTYLGLFYLSFLLVFPDIVCVCCVKRRSDTCTLRQSLENPWLQNSMTQKDSFSQELKPIKNSSTLPNNYNRHLSSVATQNSVFQDEGKSNRPRQNVTFDNNDKMHSYQYDGYEGNHELQFNNSTNDPSRNSLLLSVSNEEERNRDLRDQIKAVTGISQISRLTQPISQNSNRKILPGALSESSDVFQNIESESTFNPLTSNLNSDNNLLEISHETPVERALSPYLNQHEGNEMERDIKDRRYSLKMATYLSSDTIQMNDLIATSKSNNSASMRQRNRAQDEYYKIASVTNNESDPLISEYQRTINDINKNRSSSTGPGFYRQAGRIQEKKSNYGHHDYINDKVSSPKDRAIVWTDSKKLPKFE